MISSIVFWLCFAAYAVADSKFILDLTWETGSPDGVEREMVFINGQFPGPTLNIKQGDWVEIEVNNQMSTNITIHSHGIFQLNTPWMDGVPGLSETNIEPGDSRTYRWHADQYGSYFYHAHSGGLIDDGCYGAIIIKPTPGSERPFDKIAPAEVDLLEAAEAKVQPLIMSDWRHMDSKSTWSLELAANFETSICQDALLVNGKGAVDCWPQDEIDKNAPASFVPLLQQMNLTMTPKGCLPPELLAAISGTPADEIHLSAIPPEVFSVCTPTKGSKEVVKAPKNTKWLALDIISSASIDSFSVSIDEHPMWIYAVDGHYIEPMQVDALGLNNGDRFSVFLELTKKPANYGIRISSTAAAQLIDTTAVLAYDGAPKSNVTGDPFPVTSTPCITRSGAPVSSSVRFFDQSKMISFPPQFPQPAPEADQTFMMTLQNVGNQFTWGLESVPYDHAVDTFDPPLLYQSPYANKTNPITTLVTKNNTWVDLIFIITQVPQPPHPIHKHSNKAFIIGQGNGFFNWTSVAEAQKAVPGSFNLVNPPYRDGFITPNAETGPAWLAVRYQVVNPGAFMLHCHIQSHLNGGMAIVILDGVDEWPEVPSEYRTS